MFFKDKEHVHATFITRSRYLVIMYMDEKCYRRDDCVSNRYLWSQFFRLSNSVRHHRMDTMADPSMTWKVFTSETCIAPSVMAQKTRPCGMCASLKVKIS